MERTENTNLTATNALQRHGPSSKETPTVSYVILTPSQSPLQCNHHFHHLFGVLTIRLLGMLGEPFTVRSSERRFCLQDPTRDPGHGQHSRRLQDGEANTFY